MSARASIAIAAFALAGCTTVVTSPEQPAEQTPVEAALDYGSRVIGLSPDEQRREAAAAERAFAAQPASPERMRLALLLATPGAVVQDDARAARLLEPLAAPDARDSMTPLARLLSTQIAARQREARRAAALKGEADAARAQAEAAKVQSEAARTQAETARTQGEAARAQVDELRNQLEALKALERSMIERGARPPAK